MATIQPDNSVTMKKIPQTTVAMPTSDEVQAKDVTLKKVICWLAIAEIVFGIISVVTGIIVTIGDKRPFYFPAVGEGIWGGGFVVITGSIGVRAGGRTTSNVCWIYTYMGLSIFGSVVSGLQFSVGVLAIVLQYTDTYLSFYIITNVAAMSSLLLLVISASFCCCIVPRCCGFYELRQTQVLYVTNNPEQAVMMPAKFSGTNQTFIVQTYQPTNEDEQQKPTFPLPFIPSNDPNHLQSSQDADMIQTKHEESMQP